MRESDGKVLDDFGGFRFMLTEENREMGLLRQNRSSTETDEQLLEYLSKKRSSQLIDYEYNLSKRSGSKSIAAKEPEKVKEVDQFPQDFLNESIDKCEIKRFPSDLSVNREDEDEPQSVNDEKKERSICSPTATVTKFFIEKKLNELGVKDKPPIYRNINHVYGFKSTLKKGIYSTVNKYFSTIRKIDVAIKIIPKIGIPSKRFFKFVPRELDLAREKKFRHPNIVLFIETYEIGLRIYIMMEYIEKGNLSEFINARGRLDPATYRTFFTQLIEAVNYCLDYGICHRKLCTDNCLITNDFVLKLCNFSYCREIDDRNELLGTFCGVLGFTAPEILMCRKYRPNMTESWSCGVILFTMVYGTMPFDCTNFAKLLKQVMKPIKYHWYNDTPLDAIMIMYQCISPIDRRWSVQKILGHRWVTPPSTNGYENYMKWYKKRTRGPSIPVLRKKLKELREVIKRDYVIPFNEEQEKMYQSPAEEEEEEEEANEKEKRIRQLVKKYMKFCES